MYANLFPGPVSIDHITIIKDVHIPNISIADTETTEQSLYQVYTDKVTLKGNLYVTNMQTSKLANVTINGKIFGDDEIAQYWSKSKHQVSKLPMRDKV